MGGVPQVAFIAIEALLIGLTAIAFVALGLGRLTSSLGIHRDGLNPGSDAPAWSLSDNDGWLRRSPHGKRWQLLLFANHALQSFASVAEGLRALARSQPNVEILVMCQGRTDVTLATTQALGLQVPVISVDQSFYDRYRVRVMPFGYVIDPEGIVRSVGLVNAADGVVNLWQRSYISLDKKRELVRHPAGSTT
jgi:hypothetical protein